VVWLIHLCFDVMVGLGFLLLAAGLWVAWEWWRRRRLPPHRLFWAAGAVSGLAAIVAMECGWVVTEVGRQPWVVYRLQTTAAAATTNGGVITSLSLVIVVYAVLGAATLLTLRMLARRWRRGDARLLTASRPRGIRVPAALGVAAVIWGWGVAQYPELLPGTTMTLASTGTPHATLVAIIWLSAAGVLAVGPSYALLFALQGRQVLQAGDEETDFPG
jgi:hypothetical protein